MQKARKAERVRSLLSAHVVFNSGNSTLDCIVRNISPVGARLEIADSMALPTEFELKIPSKNKMFRAHIVWRSDGLVGVEMVDGNAEAAAVLPDETEADRCDRLMKENAKLKAQIFELKQRIAQMNEGY